MASKGTGVTYAVVNSKGKVTSSGVTKGVSQTSTSKQDVQARAQAVQKKAATPAKNTGKLSLYRSKNGTVDVSLSKGATGALKSLASTKKNEAPQNVGQWLINLISTGNYAMGEAAARVQPAASEAVLDAAKTKAAGGNVLGSIAGGVGNIVGAGLEGAGIGFQEGIGKRPEGRAPNTVSKVMNGEADLSEGGEGDDAVALANATNRRGAGGINSVILGDDGGEKVVDNGATGALADLTKKGLLNFGEDVAFDPTTFLSLGAGGAVKGALSGARAGAKLAGDAAEAAGGAARGARLAGGLKGAVTGAAKGGGADFVDQFERPGQMAENFILRGKTRRDARAAARGVASTADEAIDAAEIPARGVVGTADDVPVQAQAAAEIPGQAPLAEPEIAARAAADAVPEQIETPNAVDTPENATQAVGNSIAADNLRSIAKERDAAVRGAVQEINGPLGRIAIDDPAGVLDDAAQAVGPKPILTADHVQALQQATQAGPAALSQTMKLLKTDKDLAKVLRAPTKITVNGEPITVSRLVERIATKTATGVNSPAAVMSLRQDQHELARILAEASRQERTTSPSSLAESLSKRNLELPEGLNIQELFERVKKAGSPEARQQVLKDALEREAGQRFATVDDALQAAVGGELDFASMRRIAKALGLTTARTRNDLQKILTDRAMPAWEDIQRQLDTPEDVAVAHGIMPDAIDRAAEADLPAAQERASTAYDAAVRSTVDEILGADGRSATREMLDAAVQSLGRVLVKPQGELVPGATEAFGNGRWLDQWRQTARLFSRTIGARKRALPGERSVAADTRILAAMEGVEDYARSLGVFPRISDEAGVDAFGGPLYASIGQLLRGLPDDVRRAAFFPENISMENVTKGITLYPTTFGNGIRRAVTQLSEGRDVSEIAADFRIFIDKQARLDARKSGARVKNSWVGTEQGQRAIDDLAAAVAEPGYLDYVRSIHDATEALAVRAASDAADGVTVPAMAGLTEIISRGGPDMRREILDTVNRARADADAQRAATSGTDNLVSDLAHQRLTQGLIEGILGEDGTRQLRAEQRLVKGQEPEDAARAAREAAERARAGERGGKVRREPAAAKTEQLQKAANDAAADAADNEALIADAVDEVNGYREDTDLLSDIETLQQARAQMGILGVANDVMGVNLSGSFGMGQRLKAGLMRGENFANTSAMQFTTQMRKLVRGWGKDLQPELHLNKAADYDTIVAQSRHWISLLARAPEDIGPAQLKGWLQDQGLSEATSEMASKLKDQIDHVFGSSLGRSRVLSDDLYKQMSRYGADSLPDPRQPLGDQSTIWKQWSDAAVDPLDTLNRWSHAVKMAQVMPNVAHAAEQSFGHKALGMTAAEAKAAGWKRLNVAAPEADLAKHFSADTYFDPDTIRRLSYVQHFLNASARFEAPVMKQVVGVYDAVLRVLKSAATVWRPGHHVTNILGEIGVNLMDGVSPLNTVRAMRSMYTGGSLLDADWSILDRIGDNVGGAVNPKYLTGDVIVNVNGRGVSVSLKDLYSEAIASGVAQSHSTARDIADPLVEQLHPTRLRKVQERLGVPDELLGKFSAARDNVTRMAHYISVLERGQYKSLDEAFNKASTRVHDFHPSFLTLSMGERKYARRIFYFYTWQRQAISLVLRTAADRPGLVSMPSKLQYGFAEASGLNPESIGQVQNGDPRLPSYYQDTLLGPSWVAGDRPFQAPEEVEQRILRTAGLDTIGITSVDDAIRRAKQNQISLTSQNALLKALGDSQGPYTQRSTIEDHLNQQAGQYWAANQAGNLWGLSLSQPQIDTLQSLFAGANVSGQQKGVVEGTARELLLGNLAPTLRAPIEIAAQRQLTGNMSELDASGGTGAYLFNQFGAPSQIAKLLPSGDGSGQSVYQSKFPRTSDKYTTPESNANQRNISLLNYLLGMKFTNYTGDSAQAVRRVEDAEKAAAGQAAK